MVEQARARKPPTLADLPEVLLAEGSTSFTVAEIAQRLRTRETVVRQGVKRMMDRGRVVSPVRGLYVPVPLEYRNWGAPPAVDMVDAMMRHLGRAYYVGLLSAAELHGVAHQRPQVFQVAVDAQVRDRQVGRSEFRFYMNSRIELVPTVQRNTATGVVTVSSVEATMFDLAGRPAAAGGLDNVATVISELLDENLVDFGLLEAAAKAFPASAVRRVGWIMENLCGQDIAASLDARDTEPTVLDPHSPRRGPIDDKWRIVVNSAIEPDA